MKEERIHNLFSSELSNFISTFFGKKPLKIGMISYYYPTPRRRKCTSGVAIYTYFVSKELAKLGCNVHVFTSSNKKSKTSKCNLGKGSLTVHEISTFSKIREEDPILRRRTSYFIFENKIPSEISKENKKGGFDFINTNGWLTSGAFMAKQFLGVKWVHTFHAVEIRRESLMSEEEKKYFSLYEWIERTIKHADHFISVSKNLKYEIMRTYNISSRKISIIPNGVDISIFKPKKLDKRKYGFKNNQKVIMTVSRFSKEKGISTLIEAMPLILEKRSDTAFLLVLPGNFEIKTHNELKKRIEELVSKYKNRIKLITKPVSQKVLSNLYNIADLYIQPSLYESFGITILEAMACGKAIVASDCGGIPEIVFNGYNGLLTRPGEAEDLVRDVIRILDSPALKKIMEKNSIRIAKKYTWEKVGRKTLKLYETL